DEIDPSAIEPCSPAELAARVSDPAHARQLVHAMVVLAFMEHPPSDDRHRSIAAYARALGVDDAAVKTFGDHANEHSKRLLFDIFRYLPYAEMERGFAHTEGMSPVLHSVLATLGKGESPALTAKFRALEELPVGSLGRALFDMYEAH